MKPHNWEQVNCVGLIHDNDDDDDDDDEAQHKFCFLYIWKSVNQIGLDRMRAAQINS